MTKTPNLNLNVPDYKDQRWDVPVNENWTLIDVAVAGRADTDLSNLSATGQAVLDAKANNSDVVKLTGNQTVAGEKTFTDDIRLQTSSIEKDIIFKNTTLDLTQSSRSSTLYSFFRALDKNGNIGGSVGYVFSATGTSTAILQARNKVTGTLISGEIGINVDKNGTVYTSAPTPATSDNSTKIATTAFVKAQGYVTSSGTVAKANSVTNQRDTSTAVKTWTGTKAQYNAITTKDANTLYNITDDTDVSLTLLEALYPVGSIYITTANTCPLGTLISGSTWELVSSGRVLQGADSGHVAGTTIEAGLPNITGHMDYSRLGIWNDSSDRKSGVFSGSYERASESAASYDTGHRPVVVDFDASRSSSIYGKSSTVQPPAYVVNIYRRTA